MVPRVSRPGRSFTGAWAYYFHDKRDAAQIERGEGQHTAGRVEWIHVENAAGIEDERAAIGLMIDTARQSKRCEKPVYAFSLGWHPEQRPERAEMIEAGREALKVLGMENHQAVFVAHNDTAHKHVHVIVNRVHPETLTAANNYRDQEKLSAWALEQERAQNRVYCKAREVRANARETSKANAARTQEKLPPPRTRYVDNTLAECWTRSDGGKSFLTALEVKGWKLARGDRKENVLMAVTPSGRAFAVLRELNKGLLPGQKLKGADVDRKLADLNRELLPSVEQVQGAIAEERPRREKKKEKEQKQAQARRPEEQQWALDMRIREERRKLHARHERERQEQESKAAAKIETARREAIAAQRITQQRETIKALEARLQKGGWLYRASGKAKEDRENLEHAHAGLERSRKAIGWATDGAQARAAEEAKILSWRQEDERAALETRIEDARKLGEWRERDPSRTPGMQAGRGEARSQGQGLGQSYEHGRGQGGLSQ